MKNVHISALFFTIVCVVLVSKTISGTDQFITRKMVRGESVSLVCIEIYGYYSAELGRAVKSDNPDVIDINVVSDGQVLRFRKPTHRDTKIESAASDHSEAPQGENPFIQKIKATQGVVTYVHGSAGIIPINDPVTIPLSVNTQLNPGDQIITGPDGRVEIIINRESVVRLKENTQMIIEGYRDNRAEEGKTRVNCQNGTIWTKMKRFRDRLSRFELSLPTAIAGVHGTVYQVSVNSESESEVKVYSGEVAVRGASPQSTTTPSGEVREIPGPHEVAGPREVSMEEWTQIVKSMNMVSVGRDGKPSEQIEFNRDPDDEWEQWNEDRDRIIAQIIMKGEQ